MVALVLGPVLGLGYITVSTKVESVGRAVGLTPCAFSRGRVSSTVATLSVDFPPYRCLGQLPGAAAWGLRVLSTSQLPLLSWCPVHRCLAASTALAIVVPCFGSMISLVGWARVSTRVTTRDRAMALVA